MRRCVRCRNPLPGRFPRECPTDQAACVPVPFGTADDCLFEFGHLVSGETALVHAGAGGVGIAAIQLAKRAGARVLATASNDDKLERLKELGLDEGINYRRHDFVAEARRLTDGRGVDVIVDSVGGATLQGSIRALGLSRPMRHCRRRRALAGRASRHLDHAPEQSIAVRLFHGSRVAPLSPTARACRPSSRGHRPGRAAGGHRPGVSRCPRPRLPMP